jgi:titin
MEGTEYYFRVMAENDMGLSEDSRIEIPVKVKAPHSEAPLPPLGLRHVAMRRGSVTLAWDAPWARTLQGMKGYLIQRRDEVSDWTDVATLPASTTRYTVPDLTEDRQYRFRVYTESAGGLSVPVEYEPPVFTAKSAEIPYRPIGPMIIKKLTERSVQLEWRPPLDEGGAGISGYMVEMSESGGPWRRVGYVNARETRYTVAGLQEGLTYFFRVAAENAVGFSAPLQSDCVIPTKPEAAPAPPSHMAIKDVRGGGVTLEWQPSDQEGRSHLTGYLIEKRDTAKGKWSFVHKVEPSLTSYDVTGLMTGRQYQFRVRPVNTVGLGDAIQPDDAVVIRSQYQAPSAPRGPLTIFNVSSNSADLKWSAPDVSGGSPITNYVIEMRDPRLGSWQRVGLVDPMETRYRLSNLMQGVDYMVRVMARNREGQSAPLQSEMFSLVAETSGPSKPNMLRVQKVTRDSATLTWLKPMNSGGSAIKNYVILKKVAPGSRWEEVGSVLGSATSYTVINLREGREHMFAVYAVTRRGKGDTAETIAPVIPQRSVGKPASPESLDISSYKEDSVQLCWRMPVLSGPVSGYRIEKKESGKARWELVDTVDSFESSYTVRNLRPGASYSFRVLAENVAGLSTPRVLDSFWMHRRTPYTPPTAPSGPILVTEVTRTTATIAWRPPVNDGGAAISAYVIEKKESHQSSWSRVARILPQNLSYTIINLIEETEYVFRVFAENIEGLSDPLTLESVVVPHRRATAPEPPSGRIKIRRVTSSSVLVEWNAPHDNGGSRITGYIVEYREIDHFRWLRAGTTDAYTLALEFGRLREGHEYLFRVIAVNAVGESDPVEVDMAIRPLREREPPSSPGGPLVVTDVHKHSMTLTWQPPASDGGAPITGYIVEIRDTSVQGSWTRVDRVRPHVFHFTVSHLIQGHNYVFRVIAENAMGRSYPLEARVPTEAKSPYSVPDAPGRLRVTGITEDSVTIEWTETMTIGGAPITAYVIEKRESSVQSWTHVASVSRDTTQYRIQHLLSMTSYCFRVAAENEEGLGRWKELEEPITPTKPKNLPSAPTNLQVDYITRDSATLKWDKPKDTGGVPLVGYIIEQQDGKGRWHVRGGVDAYRLWYTVHNLLQGFPYRFRIRAENPDGVGPPATLPEPVTPKAVVWKPSAPALIEVANLTEDGVTLSWLPPERDGGSRIIRYIVEKCDPSTSMGWVPVQEVDSSAVLITYIEGLKEGRPYLFRVSAENEVGLGTPAELRDAVIPRGQIGAPSVPEGPLRLMRLTRNTVSLQWCPPKDNGGSPIERYTVEKRVAERSMWTQAATCPSDMTACTVAGLTENEVYFFRVVAQNAYGLSEPLEYAKPVIPKRVLESTSMRELESFVQRDSHVTSERTVVRVTQTSSRYHAYSDEPLTATSDSLASSLALMRL